MTVKNPLFKIIVIISILTGAMFGVIALIPFLSFFVMIILMFFMAPFILIYFKHLNLISDTDMNKSMIYGAVSGFSAFIGYSVIFFPMAFVIDLIFKTQTFFWVKVVCQNFLFIILTVFFTAFLCAMLNAFSGFLTSYVFEYFNKSKR